MCLHFAIWIGSFGDKMPASRGEIDVFLLNSTPHCYTFSQLKSVQSQEERTTRSGLAVNQVQITWRVEPQLADTRRLTPEIRPGADRSLNFLSKLRINVHQADGASPIRAKIGAR